MLTVVLMIIIGSNGIHPMAAPTSEMDSAHPYLGGQKPGHHGGIRNKPLK
jgi:hypothetical protein